jgi:N-methylhydantoinase A
VGAGGGSIAWIDEGGGLKVGPQSAGANPGPICYGRGGTEPALSDALLVAGVLGYDIAGGRLHLDRELARQGLERLAAELQLTVDRVVTGVIEIAEANMANAVRSVSVWKGLDPRDLTLVAFGGAGGMVAGHVARALDIPRVLVPVFPGNTCAMGLLMTDMQEDATVAYLARAGGIGLDAVNERLGALRDRVEETLSNQGVDPSAMTFRYLADLRYHGQIHELSVPFESFPVTQATLDGAFAAFEQMYENIYTIRLEGGSPEMTSLRVTGVGHIPQYTLGEFGDGDKVERTGSRDVLEAGQWIPVDVYSRYALPAGTEIMGPTIVEEPGSTIWVASGMSGEVDRYGNFVITTDIAGEPAREPALIQEA